MLHIEYEKLNTPFIYPFVTAHGKKTHQPALVVKITYAGVTGLGEAPAIDYYNITVDGMIALLEQKLAILSAYNFTHPDRFWHFCHHLFNGNNFLICALDMAYWDLFTKIKHKKMYQYWNLEWKNTPLTNYTIGIDTVENMICKLKENPNPIYKIKLGTPDDIKIIQELRKYTSSIFRVDANAGWTLTQALDIIPQLQNENVELVEQPLAKENWDDMEILFHKTTLPIFADEACVEEDDVEKCCTVFHGINIKLTKCGGITPALRMIENAKIKNKKIMMGCTSETEIGSYAIANFLPLLDYVDMDGCLLLNVQTPNLLTISAGKIIL